MSPAQFGAMITRDIALEKIAAEAGICF